MTHQQVFNKLDIALEEFGTHAYYDKGVDEVFDSYPITRHLMTMSGKDAGIWMKGLLAHAHGKPLMEQLAHSLQKKDEAWFDDMLEESGVVF